MSIKVKIFCPHCGTKFNIINFREGAAFKCTKCQNNFQLSLKLQKPPNAVASETQEVDADPLIGAVIGPARIERRLGQGSWGAVYSGKQFALDREVAIKLLRKDLAKETRIVFRYLREARLMGVSSHPNLAAIYDLGKSKGYYYIIMEFVRGQDLKAMVQQRGALRVQDAIEYVLQVARGLSAIHRQHIVHRDIKPTNILVTDDQVVKLLDFGFAKRTDVRSDEQGHTLGTPHYMSPEQIMGDYLDGRSDLYSLGVTFYYLVTGRLPFSAETLQELVDKHLRETPEPPHLFRPGLDPFVSGAIQKLLKKDPRNRYRSADALVRDLERLRRGESLITFSFDQDLMLEAKDSRMKFGDYVVQAGFATASQIESAVAEQKRMRDEGFYLPLGEVLIEKKVITEEQAGLVLHEQDIQHLECRNCHWRGNMADLDPKLRLTCPACAGRTVPSSDVFVQERGHVMRLIVEGRVIENTRVLTQTLDLIKSLSDSGAEEIRLDLIKVPYFAKGALPWLKELQAKAAKLQIKIGLTVGKTLADLPFAEYGFPGAEISEASVEVEDTSAL